MRLVRGSTRRMLVAGLLLAGFLFTSCETGAYPADLFPEMHYQQSHRAGEPPYVATPEGSVPTTGAEPELTDFVGTIAMENPVATTGHGLEQGRRLFVTNCSMCHGPAADGDSFVAQKFEENGAKRPASLLSETVTKKADGALFWSITNGIGNMPSFKRLLTATDRWTIIAYLRTLQ